MLSQTCEQKRNSDYKPKYEMKMFDRCIVLNGSLFERFYNDEITGLDILESERGLAFCKGNTFEIKQKGTKGVVYNRHLICYIKEKYYIVESTCRFCIKRRGTLFILECQG